ncbi:hypothetical protein [Sphingobium amiense]|uniref:hypothetical protein n=1 Tax=Sphingobium amiense TaxID=135719 RepID=UPI000A90D167|nr:hypothetical protein [Sphingobium amiense]
MRIARLLERRAQARREGIAAALTNAGVEAHVEGEAVRIGGRGLRARWMRNLALREAGRGL